MKHEKPQQSDTKTESTPAKRPWYYRTDEDWKQGLRDEKIREDVRRAREREDQMKKKLPSHGTMTKGNYGDIGAKRQEESVKVGGFKAGSTVKASAKM